MSVVVFKYDLDAKGGVTEAPDNQSADWLHLDYSEPGAYEVLSSLGLPEGVAESLVREDTRPRATVTSDGALLFLRAINLNPGSEPEDMVSLRMWLTSSRLVTVRQRKLLSVQAVRDSLQAGNGAEDVIGIALEIIREVSSRITEFVSSVDERIGEVEEQYLETQDFSQRANVAGIRREVATVKRFLSPQKDALNSLLTQMRDSLSEADAFHLRDHIDRITRSLEDLDLIRERAMVLQEEMANLNMEQQNQRMYALSIIAAIFLPITFVTGVFGMNVAGLPGIEEPGAFSMVVIAMVALTAAVMGYFRANRWL